MNKRLKFYLEATVFTLIMCFTPPITITLMAFFTTLDATLFNVLNWEQSSRLLLSVWVFVMLILCIVTSSSVKINRGL